MVITTWKCGDDGLKAGEKFIPHPNLRMLEELKRIRKAVER